MIDPPKDMSKPELHRALCEVVEWINAQSPGMTIVRTERQWEELMSYIPSADNDEWKYLPIKDMFVHYLPSGQTRFVSPSRVPQDVLIRHGLLSSGQNEQDNPQSSLSRPTPDGSDTEVPEPQGLDSV